MLLADELNTETGFYCVYKILLLSWWMSQKSSENRKKSDERDQCTEARRDVSGKNFVAFAKMEKELCYSSLIGNVKVVGLFRLC